MKQTIHMIFYKRVNTMNKIIKKFCSSLYSNEIYKDFNYNLKDFGFGINKEIKINIFKPTLQLIFLMTSVFGISYLLIPFSLCQFIWFGMGLFLTKNIITIDPLIILFNFKVDQNNDNLSFWEKIFRSLEFTPKTRYQLAMFCFLTVLCLLPNLLKYYIFTLIGIAFIFYLYKKYWDDFLDWIQDPDPKRTSKVVYLVVCLIYLIDLLVVYNITVSVFKMFELFKANMKHKEPLVWLSILEISLNLRIQAKYKWIMCYGFLIVWMVWLVKSMFTIEFGLGNLVWLILSTFKFSYRNDLDKFLEILRKNATIEKAKEIAWDNAGKLPTFVWSSLKSNLVSLWNDPVGWYNAEGFSFQGIVDKINIKEENVMKFTNVLENYKENSFAKMFSKYYFLLPFLIIFLTTTIRCKLNSLEIFIFPIILISYLLDTYFHSDFTRIDFEERLTNIVDGVEEYTKQKLSTLKGLIQTIYTAKSTAGGTLGGGLFGATTGGFLGVTLSSLASASLTGGGSLLGASLGSIYCGYSNYKNSTLECVPDQNIYGKEKNLDDETKKFQEFVKSKEKEIIEHIEESKKMIEMKEIKLLGSIDNPDTVKEQQIMGQKLDYVEVDKEMIKSDKS